MSKTTAIVLILISPLLYWVVGKITYAVALKILLRRRKTTVIHHYHNGEHISTTTVEHHAETQNPKEKP